MAATFYVVHSGKTKGIHGSWLDMKRNADNVSNAVFAKFSMYHEALHFLDHGVYPWKGDIETVHVFIKSISPISYNIYDTRTMKVTTKSLPEEWKHRTENTCSLLALSDALELCSTALPKEHPIVIHFDFPHSYPYNCVTKWITTWEKTQWIKRDGRVVGDRPLLQIISEQRRALPNVHYCYHKNVDNILGIDGFIIASNSL